MSGKHAKVPLPEGETIESIKQFLVAHAPEGAGTKEMEGYIHESMRRFLYTLDLVPRGNGTLLEIGSNPYYMTLLLRKFRSYTIQSTNYFGETIENKEHTQNVLNEKTAETIGFKYRHFNVEKDVFPYPDKSFDVVLFCEVLEHLISDPLHTLENLHRILKKDGTLILTTPNAARYQNVQRLLAGRNIYDPYSGYGVYGRHNREYTRNEVHMLLEQFGFEFIAEFTADSLPYRPKPFIKMLALAASLFKRNRTREYGQYLFFKVRKVSDTFDNKKKEWLFRSY